MVSAISSAGCFISSPHFSVTFVDLNKQGTALCKLSQSCFFFRSPGSLQLDVWRPPHYGLGLAKWTKTKWVTLKLTRFRIWGVNCSYCLKKRVYKSYSFELQNRRLRERPRKTAVLDISPSPNPISIIMSCILVVSIALQYTGNRFLVINWIQFKLSPNEFF